MATHEPRIDAYIEKSKPFAQPVLRHFRALVHKACPDVVETIKWGMPFFDHKGLICHMAAFKEHCAIGFWKAALLSDRSLREKAATEEAMGHFGRITSKQDLPSDKQIVALIKEAMHLNESGVKLPARKAVVADLPEILVKALRKNKAAAKRFESLAPSHKKEYVQWLNGAKKEETRAARLEKIIATLAAEPVAAAQKAAKK